MPPPVDFESLPAWLAQAGLSDSGPATLVGAFCERLRAAGIPLDRANMGGFILHPLAMGQDYV